MEPRTCEGRQRFINQQQLFIETGFPARYEMVMYHPPPDAVFVSLQEVTGTLSSLAYAIPVVYIDVDEDGFLGPDDQILGRTARAMILYLPPGFESSKVSESGKRLEVIKVLRPPQASADPLGPPWTGTSFFWATSLDQYILD